MGLKNPHAGYNWTAEFMISAVPWVTQSDVSGDAKRIRFGDTALSSSGEAYNEYVTKWIIVKNRGSSDLNIGFTKNGIDGTNKLTLATSESFSADVRIKEIWLSGSTDYEMVAGITGIPAAHMPNVTGSNGYPSVG